MPETDTDLESLAEERAIESTLGNPLKDAIANFGRNESDGSEQDDMESDDSVAEEQGEEEEQPETSESDDPEAEAEEPAEEEESDEEEGEKPKGKQPKLSDLEIPMPNADGSKGPRGTGTIKVEGLPQEAADAMRHYIKQSQRLPLVEQQLDAAHEQAQIADFLEHDPFSAMVMISAARPDATEEFVKSYLQMNPGKIAQISTELELDDMTEREQKLAAKDAKRAAEDRARQSYQGHVGQYSTQRQADRLLAVAQDLAHTANVPEDEMEEFMFIASRRVAKLYQQNPRITNRDVVASLQPVVAKYAKAVTPTSSPKGKQASPKVFKAKAQKSQKFAVVGSGKTAMKPAGAVGKIPKGTTVKDAIQMVRAGKI